MITKELVICNGYIWRGNAHLTILYPNPTQDVINLSITNLPEGEKAVATVFDNSGRALLTKEVFNGITSLDFSTFNSGIYHVKLSSGNRELFYKVAKK